MGDLPLAAASIRLRGKPGRPRTHPPAAGGGTPGAQRGAPTRENTGENGGAPVQESGRPSPSALLPRLLTLPAASAYLSLARTTLLDLEAAGALRRARVVVRGREIRRRLYDRAALDRLADGWTAP